LGFGGVGGGVGGGGGGVQFGGFSWVSVRVRARVRVSDRFVLVIL